MKFMFWRHHKIIILEIINKSGKKVHTPKYPHNNTINIVSSYALPRLAITVLISLKSNAFMPIIPQSSLIPMLLCLLCRRYVPCCFLIGVSPLHTTPTQAAVSNFHNTLNTCIDNQLSICLLGTPRTTISFVLKNHCRTFNASSSIPDSQRFCSTKHGQSFPHTNNSLFHRITQIVAD